MPAAAARARTPRGGVQTNKQGARPTTQALVPFTAASHEHTEIAFDETVEFQENTTQLGPFGVPAYGYMRHMLIEVLTVTEGEGAEAEANQNEDCPWNVFTNIQINDVNGAPIFGPLDGFASLYASIIGGYAGRPDPRTMPYYQSSVLKPQFLLRVPIEISHRDGFGALANQNAAAQYQMYLTLNNKAGLMKSGSSAKLTKAPKIRIRGWLEAWSLPNEKDIAGNPQAEAPPMLDSAQYYSYYKTNVQNGSNTKLLVRVGSLIRNLAVICRNESGVRKDKVMSNPAILEWDSRSMREDSQLMLQEHMAASIPELKTRDTGVFCYLLDRSLKNTVGDDSPNLWYPTVQSTRLEMRGNNEEAGTWQIITNDVAPVSVLPAERYMQESATGFHPESGGAGYAGGRG